MKHFEIGERAACEQPGFLRPDGATKVGGRRPVKTENGTTTPQYGISAGGNFIGLRSAPESDW